MNTYCISDMLIVIKYTARNPYVCIWAKKEAKYQYKFNLVLLMDAKDMSNCSNYIILQNA